MLTARTEAPRKTLRIVVRPVVGGHLDLQQCTCQRMLCTNGELMEVLNLNGGKDGLGAEELERWIASFPLEAA